jgi:tetratricopeptide (TPR) repeat protein
VEHGKATVETAAAWWRSAPGAAQTEAPQEIGLLALALWRAGHTDPAIALLRECIGLFEQRGERNGAARQRLLLAEILWRDWRATEAAEALPDPAALDGELRKHFLEQRAAIHQKAGRLEDALADYREILRQAEAGPQVEEAAIAVARGTLAEACLDTGNLEEAESLARDAWDWLSAANHPEAAGICVTLAVISWNRQRSVSGWIDEGLRRIEETSSLIVPATKARFLETTAVRLEKAGLPGEAARCRLAADGHWESLGLPAKFAVAQAFPACVV